MGNAGKSESAWRSLAVFPRCTPKRKRGTTAALNEEELRDFSRLTRTDALSMSVRGKRNGRHAYASVSEGDWFAPVLYEESFVQLGDWHIVVLNSEFDLVGGCGSGSVQEQWLRQDLKDHPTKCTLAYWHKPLFSSGAKHGNDGEMKPFWDALYAANVEVVINGHDHDYERFAPQDPTGKSDPQRGIREFVVGTGGKNSHRIFASTQPNSEMRQADTFGVLKLTLYSTSYDWEFVPEEGKTFKDSGSAMCH
jgi:hypothetical protein